MTRLLTVILVEGSPEKGYRIPNESIPTTLQDWLDNSHIESVTHREFLTGWDDWQECLEVNFGDGNIQYAFAKPSDHVIGVLTTGRPTVEDRIVALVTTDPSTDRFLKELGFTTNQIESAVKSGRIEYKSNGKLYPVE